MRVAAAVLAVAAVTASAGCTGSKTTASRRPSTRPSEAATTAPPQGGDATTSTTAAGAATEPTQTAATTAPPTTAGAAGTATTAAPPNSAPAGGASSGGAPVPSAAATKAAAFTRDASKRCFEQDLGRSFGIPQSNYVSTQSGPNIFIISVRGQTVGNGVPLSFEVHMDTSKIYSTKQMDAALYGGEIEKPDDRGMPPPYADCDPNIFVGTTND